MLDIKHKKKGSPSLSKKLIPILGIGVSNRSTESLKIWLAKLGYKQNGLAKPTTSKLPSSNALSITETERNPPVSINGVLITFRAFSI